ncbi:DNA polymerase III subunit chi [Malikia sp.]|uniref:DNA polymerase III subunit chi n=1 Tax=Malikia sp. TaxID=2070706 RepID=UPI002602141B|nr:DNA polymerase III subunit chi [Malikia sp.]MDD2730424.1 DNA polymerase III subunit chi [Malikia sp.]
MVSAQPEVAFHFNVPDPLRYLCRLLRKVRQAGMSALVCVPPELARELDLALWTFAPEEFIAHALWDSGSLAQAHSPILIADRAVDWPGAQVLVNALSLSELPPAYEGYRKVVEIVGLDESCREAARRRWRAYTAKGHSLKRHDAAAPASASA